MSVKKYHVVLRVLHWLMALIILGMIAFGWYMMKEKDFTVRLDYYMLHKSIGVGVLMLVALRIVTRLFTKVPTYPSSFPRYEKIAGHLGHLGLYALMIAVPLAGYMMSDAGGFGVKFFSIDMPHIFEDKELGKLAHKWHGWLAYGLLGLVSIHFAAVIKHRFFDKKEHDVLGRML